MLGGSARSTAAPASPRSGNRARPAGGGVRRNNRPEPAPPARRRQPLPERGGPPHATYAASRRLRLGRPLTPAWLPLPAPRQRPRRPGHSARVAPPGRGLWDWRRRRRRDSARSPAHHFRIRLLKPQSRQPTGRLRRLPRAYVLTHSARGPAGGSAAIWSVLGLHDNGRRAAVGRRTGSGARPGAAARMEGNLSFAEMWSYQICFGICLTQVAT